MFRVSFMTLALTILKIYIYILSGCCFNRIRIRIASDLQFSSSDA